MSLETHGQLDAGWLAATLVYLTIKLVICTNCTTCGLGGIFGLENYSILAGDVVVNVGTTKYTCFIINVIVTDSQ